MTVWRRIQRCAKASLISTLGEGSYASNEGRGIAGATNNTGKKVRTKNTTDEEQFNIVVEPYGGEQMQGMGAEAGPCEENG